IEKAQRAMTEFLLANHPLDCPVCDRGGECELQEMTFDWGGLEERFTEQKNYYAERYLSPMVANDPQRCILCKRCTRVCDEWMGEDAIEAGGRGAHTVIGTYLGWLDCSQCGNCIEVCPTGTLLDATYRHQTRPWELAQTISTCNYCSDGCQMSIGSRSGDVRRVVARDRYVNGINGEFLCVKGRFGHPFINHEARIRTPMIRYKKHGKLIPATWDEAIRHVAERLDAVAEQHGRDAIGVVGSPRLTNESLFVLRKFATELVGTENYTVTDLHTLQPFFDNLAAPIATQRDIRYAKTIVLIGGDPGEWQPLTGKTIRQAVRNGGAQLVLVNSVPIRLREQAAAFIHVRPGTEEAVVLALADSANDALVADKTGVDEEQLRAVRQMITGTTGNVVVMFDAALSAEAQAVIGQISTVFGGEDRRVLFHPLPLFNNSVGAHDMGMTDRPVSPYDLLEMAGETIRALYVAGSFLPEHLEQRPGSLGKLDFLVVQELFENETTAAADVVLPAASYAEVDGTFTNNSGQIQRVRQSILPLHQSKADWMIVAQLAKELGMDFGYELSASAVFRDIAKNVPAYSGMTYPLLKDESKPVQALYAVGMSDSGNTGALRSRVESLTPTGEKITVTPAVGAGLFRLGMLTEKVAQFGLLAAGNPRPETTAVSPLYQITVGA
ncbi:MAG TPA: molybdopterin-dependent oxidoreductase, partial [Pyrinomonadaceae bacterium]|nr:molybdopterin-dependent oxidoreductase [Pyrinomonadaceae bacterium]